MSHLHINDLLKVAVEQGASDLHLKAGSCPRLRKSGSLVPWGDERLDVEDLTSIASSLLSTAQLATFRETQELDFSYSIPGLGRFRCNLFRQRGSIGLVCRVVPTHISSFDELGLPPVLKKIADEERGLVLVTGTTGSGKSTTLAAIIGHINATRHAHVMTIEDPIEFLHRDQQSIINQREVAIDTKSFPQALRAALRQDPDVILVGEMRDIDTIGTALLAAETGHLVLSTLHTLDAPETVNRIITVFPPYQQKQIRLQLASVLKAIVSQRLMRRADDRGRIPAVEVMVTTPFIRSCIIEEDKTSSIRAALASGISQYGTQTFDQSIYYLHKRGLVSYDEAIRWVSNVDEFNRRMQGIATTAELALDQMAGQAEGLPAGIVRLRR